MNGFAASGFPPPPANANEEVNKIVARIKHDIRNTRGLNKTQLNYVFTVMNDQEKCEIIALMNEVLQTCHDYICEYVR